MLNLNLPETGLQIPGSFTFISESRLNDASDLVL